MTVRPLLVTLVALLDCTRGSAAPSPPPVQDDGAPAGNPHPTSSAALEACVSSRVSIETLLTSLPTACKSASDCDGYYLRASACEAPVVLAKPGCPPEREAELARLQASARRSCPPDPVACSPRPFRADCRSGRCVDALASPVPR